LETIDFDFEILCEEICRLMAVKASEKGLELLYRYAPNVPKYVKGDPGRIRQVLVNLINNAIKFTTSGHVFVDITAIKGNDGQIIFCLAVKDTGIGIPEEKVQHLFEKFTQVNSSTTRTHGGTGLGLSISKELSQIMGGSICVESTLGKGSTFCASIVLTEGCQVKSDLPKLPDLNGVRVLSVDHNEIAQTIIEGILIPLGVEVISAHSSQEALAVLAKDIRFDAVIVDHLMPGMTGEELGMKILATQAVPVLIVTTAPQKGDRKRLEAKGFSGYLSKPMSSGMISKSIGLLVEAKRTGGTLPFITQHTLKEIEGTDRSRKANSSKFANAKIMLVEDNTINRLVANTLLAQYGCQITQAGNGKEAVELFNHQKFDLVFMDCQMPVMDGFESTKAIRETEIRENLEKTIIVAFTANAMKGDDLACKAAGMDDYLTKPVKSSDLESVLLSWLPHDEMAL
jgi:CheY-like chemotaxis protein